MNELALYDNAKRAVAELLSIDEVCEHLDKAAAVQEYARRARDRELEIRAAEYRVYCERRLGEFSAAAARPGPGGRHSDDTSECSRSHVAREVGVDEKVLRVKNEPLAKAGAEDFEEAVEAVKSSGQPPTARRVLDTLHSTKGAGNEGADQWNTPDEVIALVVEVLGGLDLDPCADAGRQVGAAAHLTVADDGLAQPWGTESHPSLVYMNPPYSSARKWVEKLVGEVACGNVEGAVALLPARPDTRWFRMLRDFPVCFWTGRLTFKGAQAPAPFPSAFFYLGDDEGLFIDVFGKRGDIYVRMDR